MKIDLHAHTTVSDGNLTPEGLVDEALARQLSALAITDHDRLEGIAPAKKRAEGSSLEIISGVEVSTTAEGVTLHVLGLFVDASSTALRDYLAGLFEARLRRMETMVGKVRDLGHPVTLDEVLAQANGGSVGRNHLAKVLLKHGIVQTRQEAFDRLLARGCPGFVAYEESDPCDAIRMIRESGGKSFLAHPGLIRKVHLIDEMIAWGVDGLEVIHPEHSPDVTRRMSELCEERRLLRSGGSDYHGKGMERKGDLGEMQVPADYLRAIKQALSK